LPAAIKHTKTTSSRSALLILIVANFSSRSSRYIGTGVAIVIAAAANLIAVNAPDRAGRSILVIINAMMAGFFAAAWSVLPGPQVIVGGILFAGLAVCAWTTERGHRPS